MRIELVLKNGDVAWQGTAEELFGPGRSKDAEARFINVPGLGWFEWSRTYRDEDDNSVLKVFVESAGPGAEEK